MTVPHYALLEHRTVLRIAGEDAPAFLQGLITHDIHKADGITAIYAMLLTPQGKYLHDFLIVKHGDAYWLDCEHARIDDLKKRLSMYRLRSKVVIEDKGDTHAVLAIFPSPLREEEIFFLDPRHPALGMRAIVERSHLAELTRDWQPRAFEEYDRARIALCIPESGIDLLPEKSFPLECNLEELRGVDFEKGCYVGQEVTTRTKRRGVVRKKLFPVTVDGPLPAPGTPIMADGKEAGYIRSGRDGQAIALLRLEAVESGAALTAESARIRITS
ncbi:MAG: folate-binding protein YgfZ [Alphaproteobacteria bacterium]|nr:folate-binding protein YgfZ [Alphaproteobacteria bacterium]